MVKVEVLGGGCNKCDLLAEQVKIAAQDLQLEINLEKVTDFGKIAGYGVMVTPALVVDGDLKFSGKVLQAKDIKPFLM